MKILYFLAGLLSANAAVAHEAGPIAHIHPHGTEYLVALAAVAVLAVTIWKARR